MFSISTSSIDLAHTHSSLALNQLSEEDRKVVARLKQTYPSHILAAVFQDTELSQGAKRLRPLRPGLIPFRSSRVGEVPLERIYRFVHTMSVQRPFPGQRHIHFINDNITEQFGLPRFAL